MNRRQITVFAALACLLFTSLDPDQQAVAGNLAIQDEVPEQTFPRAIPKKVSGGKEPVVWPMRLAKGRPVPVIEAKLNGKGPFLFYFDTGAGTATLDTAFVEKMKLPIGKKTTIRGPGKGPGVKADIASIARLEIGEIVLEDFEAASFDRSKFSGGEDIVGSLGLAAFGDLPVSIDFQNNRFIVGGKGLGKADGKTVLECDFDAPVPFFVVQLADSKMNAAFDSGFRGELLIGEESLEGFKLKGEARVVGKARSVSGEVEIKQAALDGDLAVGEMKVSNPTLTIMPSILSNQEICVLGYSWAKTLTVTYDRANKRIRFVKSKTKSGDASKGSKAKGLH